MEPNLSLQTQVARIEEALFVLQQGDARLPQADAFLSSLRHSPSIWPVLHALIHSTSSSPTLAFAARTLHERLKSDWLTLDENARVEAFTLATDGAMSCSAIQEGNSSALHYFGSAAGFAIARSCGSFQNAMWTLIHDKLGANPFLKCHVLAALVSEVRKTKTGHAEKHEDNMRFCWEKAPGVVSGAITLIQVPPQSSPVDLQRLRAALSCLEAWMYFGNSNDVAAALLPLITVPSVADDVSEMLSQIAGRIGASPELLLTVSDGLLKAFQHSSDSEATTIHHAIAEAVVGISESNADELMERCTDQSRAVVLRLTELLWLCLKSPDDRTFFTALEAWTTWVTAETLVGEMQQKLEKEQIAAVVGTVIHRMQNLAFFDEITNPKPLIQAEYVQEVAQMSSFFAQTVSALGPEVFIKILTPLIHPQGKHSPKAKCAALIALGSAGEAVEILTPLERPVREAVLSILTNVIGLIEACESRTGASHDHSETIIRFCALKTLAAFASILSASASSETLFRAVRCAGNGILHEPFSESASQLLCDLAGTEPSRLTGFLGELVTSSREALTRISTEAAKALIRGLARIASATSSTKDKQEALDGMLAGICKRIRTIYSEGKILEFENLVRRDISLVTIAVHELNDSDSAHIIFEQLQPAIFGIALAQSANHELASLICRLLEVSVLPTLVDEDDDVSPRRNDADRLSLAIGCADLASNCFKRSGPDGETCWLKTLRAVTGQMTFGMEVASAELGQRALNCMSNCIENATLGLQQFCSKRYETQPEMAAAYFRLAARLVSEAGQAVLPHAELITNVGMHCLRCGEYTVAKESLDFWHVVFERNSAPDVGSTLLEVSGGPTALTAGVLCATRIPRCTNKVAETLFALCRFVSGGSDVALVLQGLLENAFKAEYVPKEGLDRAVREMLFRGCYSSTGSMVDFRRALQEMGRVCAMAMR